jgi:ArsR family transcriptional regulator, arsenate/arsenite/antimonite-responsive transcriptional repressor
VERLDRRAAGPLLCRLLHPMVQLPLMDMPAAVVALGALAQEHRLVLFRLLVQAGEDGMAAGTIAEKLGVPNSSLSFHLAQLRGAGLISQERQHRSLIYRANYPAMNALVDYLTENCCGGADCSPASLSESLPSEAKRKTA